MDIRFPLDTVNDRLEDGEALIAGVFSLPVKACVFLSKEGGQLRLSITDYAEVYEDEVESAAPEPLQEEPLQGKDGEAPPCDGRVGPAGPLPDAPPQEGEVVEGVGGDADGHLGEREAAFFEAARDAIDDLHFAYSAVRAANCGEGTLTLSNDTLQAGLV